MGSLTKGLYHTSESYDWMHTYNAIVWRVKPVQDHWFQQCNPMQCKPMQNYWSLRPLKPVCLGLHYKLSCGSLGMVGCNPGRGIVYTCTSIIPEPGADLKDLMHSVYWLRLVWPAVCCGTGNLQSLYWCQICTGMVLVGDYASLSLYVVELAAILSRPWNYTLKGTI